MKLSSLWEAVAEVWFGIRGRSRLHDEGVMMRFRGLAPRFEEIYTKLAPVPSTVEAAGRYEWGSWTAQLRKSFQRGVPLGFLSHPMLVSTMVFGQRRGVRRARWRIANVERVYGPDVAARLLREDEIGGPTLASLRWLTSANRAHHAAHLAAYREARGADVWNGTSAIEWGGGYGNMARLIRRMNPGMTYTIIDLPEQMALQYIYLGSLEGEEMLNLHDIVPGKINFVPSASVPSRDLQADVFISTWALTESAPALQQMVADRKFFNASRVLLASAIDQNNVLVSRTGELGLQRVVIPAAASIGEPHEYWFR